MSEFLNRLTGVEHLAADIAAVRERNAMLAAENETLKTDLRVAQGKVRKLTGQVKALAPTIKVIGLEEERWLMQQNATIKFVKLANRVGGRVKIKNQNGVEIGRAEYNRVVEDHHVTSYLKRAVKDAIERKKK